MTSDQLREALKVYAITDPLTPAGPELVAQVEQAIAGGATALQLRDKRSALADVISVGTAIRRLTLESGVMFIVNDRVDLALALDADGVHLGQEDFPPTIARRLLGPDKVIGVSVGDRGEARPEILDAADYVGVGPVFDSQTKKDAGPAAGPSLISDLKPMLDRPIVGIGGIDLDNAAQVILAGADGVAVVATIFRAADIAAASRQLRTTVEEALSQKRSTASAGVRADG